jgi:hypothetical protein
MPAAAAILIQVTKSKETCRSSLNGVADHYSLGYFTVSPQYLVSNT